MCTIHVKGVRPAIGLVRPNRSIIDYTEYILYTHIYILDQERRLGRETENTLRSFSLPVTN